MSESTKAMELLEGLTPKQVEVLELLAMHRTTKEIARELAIAPNTVDQRINAVREKWGTTNRKDTVRRYVELRDLCGKTTYGLSHLDPAGPEAEYDGQDLPADPLFVLSDASAYGPRREWFDEAAPAPTGLEAFDARFGRRGRIIAVFVLALVLAMTLAASLAIADVLARLI